MSSVHRYDITLWKVWGGCALRAKQNIMMQTYLPILFSLCSNFYLQNKEGKEWVDCGRVISFCNSEEAQ